ncbi:gluzincin family metallopeptidase [Mangrovivirga cuniculi]|uniref:hypothetical protein n=1 Tax=Mangrovivirga cuniculi TaxID=2715131 RepID=UPI001C2F14D0|nr:hypothetical protein [Mangrovivirga cuniculi]
MKNKFSIFSSLILLIGNFSFGQDIYDKNENVDIQHYVFNLELNDSTNAIAGEAFVTVNFKEETDQFSLDLIQKSGKYGMEVSSVFEGDKESTYQYINNKLVISPEEGDSKTRTYRIKYHGIPERGLVIDTTKYGRRSFLVIIGLTLPDTGFPQLIIHMIKPQ